LNRRLRKQEAKKHPLWRAVLDRNGDEEEEDFERIIDLAYFFKVWNTIIGGI